MSSGIQWSKSFIFPESSFLLAITVLWKTTLCPFPKLSIWAERLKHMARCLMASSVCASKKSCGRAIRQKKERTFRKSLPKSSFPHYVQQVKKKQKDLNKQASLSWSLKNQYQNTESSGQGCKSWNSTYWVNLGQIYLTLGMWVQTPQIPSRNSALHFQPSSGHLQHLFFYQCPLSSTSVPQFPSAPSVCLYGRHLCFFLNPFYFSSF